MTRKEFMARPHRDMVLIEEDPKVLVRRLRDYHHPETPRWLKAGQT